MDFSKFAKFRKPKLNVLWHCVRSFSAHLDTMLNTTSCSIGTGNILISTQWPREQPQSSSLCPAHTYVSILHNALLSHCARLPLSGLTLGLNLLASHMRGAPDSRQRHEMQFRICFFIGFLFPDFGWPTPQTHPLHSCSLSPPLLVNGPSAGLNCCIWYLVSGAREKPCYYAMHA